MKKQSGGLKLKDPSKTGFQPILDMMKRPSARLGVLAYASLKGFMLNLEVDPDDSEYYQLINGSFSTPVTSFIMKLTILTPGYGHRLPDFGKNVKKKSETALSYFEEAKLQQMIWKRSVESGHPEICPSIGNFSMFNQLDAIILLRSMASISRTDQLMQQVITYITRNTRTDDGLGIILMPKVNRSVTLAHFDNLFRQGDHVEEEWMVNAIACVAAKVAWLFVDLNVIHYDMHSNNALVILDMDTTVRCQLIDFGVASDLRDGNNDTQLTSAQKKSLMKLTAPVFRLMILEDVATDDERRNRIVQLMKFIHEKDLQNNRERYKKEMAQMTSWFAVFMNSPDYKLPKSELFSTLFNPEIAAIIQLKTYNILRNLLQVKVDRNLVQELQEYERSGQLVNFNNTNLMNYYVQLSVQKPVHMQSPTKFVPVDGDDDEEMQTNVDNVENINNTNLLGKRNHDQDHEPDNFLGGKTSAYKSKSKSKSNKKSKKKSNKKSNKKKSRKTQTFRK